MRFPHSKQEDVDDWLRRYQAGEPKAVAQGADLIGRVANSCARQFQGCRVDVAELQLELMLHGCEFFSNLKSVDVKIGSVFGYLYACLRRRAITYIRREVYSGRAKINANKFVDSENRMLVAGVAAVENDKSETEQLKELLPLLYSRLSKLERIVLKGYLERKIYSQVAEEHNLTKKAVDNSLIRIRRKAQDLLEELGLNENP